GQQRREGSQNYKGPAGLPSVSTNAQGEGRKHRGAAKTGTGTRERGDRDAAQDRAFGGGLEGIHRLPSGRRRAVHRLGSSRSIRC
ncbi:unnamed protein product, partial [Ectocarpus sp. 12 AP-2014]